MFFSTDILSQSLRNYARLKPKDYHSYSYAHDVQGDYQLIFSQFATFNDKNQFVYGIVLIEKPNIGADGDELIIRTDFDYIYIKKGKMKINYNGKEPFYDVTERFGFDKSESQLLYTLAYMAQVRMGSHVLSI